MVRLTIRGWFAFVSLGLTAGFTHAAEPVGGPSVSSGQRLFAAACSACHGKTGEGGRGPNLSDGVLIRRSTDQRLFGSIKNGIPGSDMPGFPMADAKIRDVVAFLRSLSAPAMEAQVEGNPDHGREIFFGKGGCSGCHLIRGEGGFPGPDLTNAGSTLTLKQMREAILQPSARIAEGFRAVTATTSSGAAVTGVAKNSNNYSIQILDKAGKLSLLDVGDLRNVEFSSKSLMPDGIAKRLQPAELQDLMAFLSRQTIREGRTAQSGPGRPQ